jgi:hypothetical protein
MANAFQVKTDVVNELRNRLYYNQMEIQRLINNPGLISHKEVVKTVIDYLKLNVEAQSSIELIEAYLPAPAPQVQQPESEPIMNDNGVKKID